MDPRRKLDERMQREGPAGIPFIETYTETVRVEEPIGPATSVPILVIRIKKGDLKILIFALLCVLGTLAGVAISILRGG